jgi:hypothetical protein
LDQITHINVKNLADNGIDIYLTAVPEPIHLTGTDEIERLMSKIQAISL